jgi:hypothetical protein
MFVCFSGEDAYDDAAHNQYSIDIDALLIMRKNGEHGAETDNKPCCQLLDRLLNVARVNGKHKVRTAMLCFLPSPIHFYFNEICKPSIGCGSNLVSNSYLFQR